MINLSSLAEKNARNYFDKTEYIGDKAMIPALDLRSNVWVINYNAITVDNWIVVDKSCDMRVDTISKFMYGTEDYVDVITKFNRISNAFDVKIGDVIAIPNIASFFSNVTKINYKEKTITSSKKSTKADKTAELRASIAAKRAGTGLQTYKKTKEGNITF